MTKTRKPTARRARANVVEQTGDAVLALIVEHDRLWQVKTEKATAAANALHDQLRETKPATLAGAIAQLEFAAKWDDPDMAKSVAAGLREIAGGTGVEQTGDEKILALFREWREALSFANNQTPETDEEAQPAHDRVYALERQIYDTPATGAVGMAVKAYMVATAGETEPDFKPDYSARGMLTLDQHSIKGLIEDAVRFAPELAPLARNILSTSIQRPARDQKAELHARATALTAEYDAQLPEGDAGLIEAERRFQELRQQTTALHNEFEIDYQLEEEIIIPIIDSVRDRLWDFIEQTPPVGLAGVAAKLRLLTEGDIGVADEISEGATTSLKQVAEFVEREAGATPSPKAATPASLIDSAISAVSGDPAVKALPRDHLAAAVSEALALRLLARYRDARGAVEDYGGDVTALPAALSFAEIEEQYATLMREEVLGVRPETTSAELRYLDLVQMVIADRLSPHDAPVMPDQQDLSCALELLQWVRNRANSRDLAEGLAEWRRSAAVSGKDA